MRRPSTEAELYAWHRAALRGERPPVLDGEPQCGWFKFRYVRNGPWVPARIWCEQVLDPETGELAAPEMFRAEVNGEPANAYAIWLRVAARPISEADYLALMGHHESVEAMRATHVKIDLTAKPMRP